jgi:hypothetical protein
MPTTVARQSSGHPLTSSQVVLREAKRLHRAAISDSLSAALPVLRRILAAAAVAKTTLPDLFRRRYTMQRKHVLRTLAFEAGRRSWEEYRPTLTHMDPRHLEQFAVLEKGYANLNLWFSSEPEALQFATQHGGRAVRVGMQAVVLPASEGESRGERSL